MIASFTYPNGGIYGWFSGGKNAGCTSFAGKNGGSCWKLKEKREKLIDVWTVLDGNLERVAVLMFVDIDDQLDTNKSEGFKLNKTIKIKVENNNFAYLSPVALMACSLLILLWIFAALA